MLLGVLVSLAFLVDFIIVIVFVIVIVIFSIACIVIVDEGGATLRVWDDV